MVDVGVHQRRSAAIVTLQLIFSRLWPTNASLKELLSLHAFLRSMPMVVAINSVKENADR
jgi:hypothetical protein